MSPLPNALGTRMPRPRVVGQRLPYLEQVLQDQKPVFQKLTLDWSGEGEQTQEFCTGTALWHRYGYDPLPIRSRPDS